MTMDEVFMQIIMYGNKSPINVTYGQLKLDVIKNNGTITMLMCEEKHEKD